MNTVGIENRRPLTGAQTRYETTAGRGAKGHRANAVDGDDFGGRMVSLKMLQAAHQRASGSGPHEQVIDMAEMPTDRVRRGPRMGPRVGCVLVLIEPDVTRIAGHFLANQRDACAEKPAVGIRNLDLNNPRAIAAHHADVVAGTVWIDHTSKGYPALGADHRQRHTQVAG